MAERNRNRKDNEVLVFDLDDTLYKERDYVRSGRRAVADYVAVRTGEDADSLFAMLDSFGPTDPRAFDSLLALPAASAITMAEILDVYRSHMPEISLDSDALAALRKLKKEGVRIALVTDGSSMRQRLKIAALGLDEFFTDREIFISEEVGGDKTTELPFRAVGRRFPDAGGFTYIGDNLRKDFRVARRLGWQTVMLSAPEGVNIFPQDPGSFPADYLPDRTITRLTELTD